MYLRSKPIIIFHDLLASLIAWGLVITARFNFSFPPAEVLQAVLFSAPLVMFVQGCVNAYFDLYKGLWRFASLPDLWNLGRSVLLGTLCIFLILFAVNRLENIPRSAALLYPVFLLILLGAPRLLYRIVKDRALHGIKSWPGKKVFIVGAGVAGEALIREMLRDNVYQPVAFVDDNPALQGTKIHDVPVVGMIDELPEKVKRIEPELILIAVPSADAPQMQRIVELVTSTGISYRTLPKLNDIVEGRVELKSVKEVSIDDILGRDQVNLDWSLMKAKISGKAVLITGGGGSIGQELCRQVLALNPAALTVYDQSEFNLYKLSTEFKEHSKNIKLNFVLGDVCDSTYLDNSIANCSPNLIFHAAAYKHVPLLENQVFQAIKNNVEGTFNVANSAVRQEVDSVVLISTDKAVSPKSVMGSTKRIAELICQRYNEESVTDFITVRFGNVLNSAGSVVPLFTQQIESGGPVTVTHREAFRYFMSIPEASQLILEAAAVGDGGDLFVLDMGKPVSILALAEQMITLSGNDSESIRIIFTGLRPGEKLVEELFFDGEKLAKTSHEKLLLSKPSLLNLSKFDAKLLDLMTATKLLNEKAMRTTMAEIIDMSQEATVKL